jgi:hypothetical protein
MKTVLINEVCLGTKNFDRVPHTVGPTCRGSWVRGLELKFPLPEVREGERGLFGTEGRDVGGVELA